MTLRNAFIGLSIANTLLLLAVLIAFIFFNQFQHEKLEQLITRDLVFSHAVDQTYSIGLRTGIALRNIVINPQDEVALETFETARTEFLSKANEAARAQEGKAGALMKQTVALWTKAEIFKQRILELATAGQRDAAMAVIAEDNTAWREIKQIIDQARTEQDKELQISLAASRNANTQSLVAVICLLGISLCFFALTIRFAFRRVLRPIEKLVTAVAIVGSGNLVGNRLSLQTNDELGKLGAGFDCMVDQLRNMTANLSHSIDELQLLSAKISSSGNQVATSSELQADAVARTTSSIMDINASIQNVAVWVTNLSASAKDEACSIIKITSSLDEVASLVGGLEISAREVGESITQMASANHQIDVNVQRLSEIAITTASSTFEISSSINEVERNAKDSAEISENVLSVAESGRMSVDATISGMSEIRNASSLTIKTMSDLKDKTNDIGNILKVIADVADQTNLLALNAAIIAAQAGSHGEGFAVVAKEIKGLANRTSSYTKEIEQVVNSVQDEIYSAFAAFKNAESSIVKGEQLSVASGEVLQQIVAGVKMITERLSQIASSASEQARGSQGISELMEQMTGMVNQIARATNDQSCGSEIIQKLATRMQDLTSNVNQATKEQAAVSSFIAKQAEDTTNFIVEIKNATDSQRTSSNQIVNAAQAIQDSTHGNEKTARELEDVISDLSGQIDVMRLEMSNFKCQIDEEIFPSLHKAKSAHMIFISKIQSHLAGSGRYKADELPTHHTCTFGKWYQTDGNKLCGNSSLFQSIDPPHARVHELGKQAIIAYDAGDIPKSHTLKEEMVAESEILLGIINKMALETNDSVRNVGGDSGNIRQ